MPPQIRTELRKLTTIRGPWLLLAAGPVIVVAGITGWSSPARTCTIRPSRAGRWRTSAWRRYSP